MTVLFGLLAFGGMIGTTVLAVLYFGKIKELGDAEAQFQGQLAQKEEEVNQRLSRYGNIVQIEDHVAKLQENATQWEQHVLAKKAEAEQAMATFQQSISHLESQIAERESRIALLNAELQSVEESLDMQSFGFYEMQFNLGSSAEYKGRLDDCRSRQKSMVKRGTACSHLRDWTVEGSEAKGRKMMKQKEKLMLLAFNGEADTMMAKVKFSNVETYKNRLRKAFDSVNKLGESNEASISYDYLNLKFEELYLVYEYAVKLNAEKEEQRRIKEQMQEEARAEAEIKKAQDRAEKDETKAVAALERAKAELSAVAAMNTKQSERLKATVEELEQKLKEALERKAKAIARAQLTRSGHVYVLSNIGSFGEGIFKIGLTRRLDPSVRVKELGDASVPFPFDVHAMIYSEDAPKLERALHEYFSDRRVNEVNHRKEYFRVTIEEIKEAVAELHGVITVVTVPVAEEYRQTLAKRNSQPDQSA